MGWDYHWRVCLPNSLVICICALMCGLIKDLLDSGLGIARSCSLVAIDAGCFRYRHHLASDGTHTF